MKICILGATGTLGRAVTRKLLDNTTANLVLSSRHARGTLRPTERIAVVDGDATVPEDAEKVVIRTNDRNAPFISLTVVSQSHRLGCNSWGFVEMTGGAKEVRL